MNAVRHSFVVAAYGHSPYLAACLESLARQTIDTPIRICTSTPFDGINEIAAQYRAEVIVHHPNRGIGHDWNAALQASTTELITLAHQDDLYDPGFSQAKIDIHCRYPDVAVSFCDSDEIRDDGNRRTFGFNHWIKLALVASAFLGTNVAKGNLRRRILFGFGNPVLCAGVTFNRARLSGFSFREDLRTNMDWIAWNELSSRQGIARVHKRLVSRRVHADSETAACIIDGARLDEDRQVFRQLWPSPIAAVIGALYRLSYPGYR